MQGLLAKSICAVLLLLIGSVAIAAQPKPDNQFNPPEWILGEWANLSRSESNKIERIVFSEHEIELVESLADKPTKFSRKFKKYQVQETPGRDTYKLVVSNSKEELIWEFRFCPADKCNLMTGDALSYFVMKDKKKLWDHSTSLTKVLIRRVRPS